MAYRQPQNYSIKDIIPVEDLGAIIDQSVDLSALIKDRQGNETFNIPCAFDIETTSYTNADGEKRATMYVWQFGINGYVFVGRTWDELMSFIGKLRYEFGLSTTRYLIVYVHNLAFEFQFIRQWLHWRKVFAVDNRKPAKALCEEGIEFRCSYILTGYSLEKIGEQLQRYKVRKAVGQLDYSKPRHSATPLTDDELGYCINDVLVDMAYIQECIENEGSILKIPLTKTSYVRNFCRQCCYHKKDSDRRAKYRALKFRQKIRLLTLAADEYKQLKRAFQGGFTHASPFYAGQTLHDVTSYDLTSSYPTVMVGERFPMSSGELVEDLSREEFERSLKYYCCLFDITFKNLQPKMLIDSYLSLSHCVGVVGAVTQNGRVVGAERLTTTITEIDYEIIKKFYTWDDCYVSNFRRYMKGYLPTELIQAIFKLYNDKTTLKGVEGKEIEYMSSKGMLNSCFGMSVTDIVRPEIVYDEGWSEQAADLDDAIEKYNKQRMRFLFYPWGVWITAYARRNLFGLILEAGSDYVYSDTDSVKMMNADRHIGYIETYNKAIREQLIEACKYHKLAPDLIEPKTIKGDIKTMGVWDYDGHYKTFKTLGAKRYIVEHDNGDLSLTVAGLAKRQAIPYLQKIAAQKYTDVFELFKDGLRIPRGYTGGMVHTYIDEPFTDILADYNGCEAVINEKSCVHLIEDEYTLGISQEYINYLLSISKR